MNIIHCKIALLVLSSPCKVWPSRFLVNSHICQMLNLNKDGNKKRNMTKHCFERVAYRPLENIEQALNVCNQSVWWERVRALHTCKRSNVDSHVWLSYIPLLSSNIHAVHKGTLYSTFLRRHSKEYIEQSSLY